VTGFRVADSRVVAEAGFFRVEQVTVDGPDVARYERNVVRHPGAVMVVPIDADGRAVLVRQYRVSADQELLEAPAGKRDVHGESPEATAARELEEELGLRAHRWVRLAELYDSPGFCDEYAYVFAALDLVEGGAPAPQGPEERAMTVERVALDDAEALIASRELVDAKTIIGLLLARRFLAGEYDGIA